MGLPLPITTATPVAAGSSRSVADQLAGSAFVLVGIACLALLAASVITSIVVVKMHATEKLLERDEDRILATLDELNGRLAELTQSVGVVDDDKILAGLDRLNGRLSSLAQGTNGADSAKVLGALQELNGRLAKLACTMHEDSARGNPWPVDPLVRPPRNWEDEV